MKQIRSWILCVVSSIFACVNISAAETSFDEVSWLGENLFDVIEHPIVYDYWGPIDGFRLTLEAVDTANHLAKNSPPATLHETDLFIFVMDDWGSVTDIPYRFADLLPVFDLVDMESDAASTLFDITVNDNGSPRPIRVSFVSLADVPDSYSNASCLVPYIFTVSLYKHKKRQLAAQGCKKSD